jgi:hypothetical protein
MALPYLEGELGDQALELRGHSAEGLRGFLHVGGAAGGVLGGDGDPADILGDFTGALGGLAHVAGDLVGSDGLFFDGRGDVVGNIVDLVDDGADLADGLTAPLVSLWMASIFWPISSVALAVSLASSLTSLATTAKPLPASPARAASMVALRASRLVCCAMEVMTLMTLPISTLDSPSLAMVWLVDSATPTAALATLADSLALLAISRMEACICSLPVATTVTFLDTCSLAAETTLAWVAVSSALEAIWLLTAVSSSADEASAEAWLAATFKGSTTVSSVWLKPSTILR